MASKFFRGFSRVFKGPSDKEGFGSGKRFATIGGVKPKISTKKADQIKRSNRLIKDLDKTMKKDMSPELRAKGEKLKKEVQKTQKQIYKTDFKRGGRAGFNKGSKDPVGKKKNKFPDHSGDGKITQKDILMAKGVIPKPKSKKKVI